MLAALLCGLAVAILAARVYSVVRYGGFAVTSGSEGADAYAIWKVQRGLPLYEWPDRWPYAFTPYNFLFFRLYAAAASAVGATGATLVLVGRVLTLTAALGGALAQWRLMARLARPMAPTTEEGVVLGLLALVTWLAPGFTGWWTLTVRPDLPAETLALLGVIAYLRGLDTGSRRMLVAASLSFAAAWAFKQVAVWTLTGVVLHALLWRRDWREILAVALPAASAMAISLAVGGPAYRYSVVTAQSINPVSLVQAASMLGPILVQNAFAFGAPLFAIALAWTGRRSSDPARGADDLALRPGLTPLWVIAAVGLAAGFVAMGREGSSRNQLLEGFVALSTIAGVASLRVLRARPNETPDRLAGAGLCGLLLVCTLIVAAQVLLPNRYGRLAYTPSDRERGVAVAAFVRDLPRPLLTSDETFCQPWWSTGDRYPAICLVSVYYDAARDRGLLRDGGLEAMIGQRAFASLLLDRGHPFIAIAERAGYAALPGSPALDAARLVALARASAP